MIKNELKSLLHNKLLLVVLIAIILIPSIYAGLFLSSMWDPYGDLNYLPVAVVNKDKSVVYNDETLSVGDDLAESLSENDSMAFNIVDEDTAQTGLENGTYYMVITIPENFSANAATVMDDEPQQMVLDYQTNPGVNYISMKLSESAMKEIKANIMEEVTRSYTETVFDNLVTVADGFDDAVDGTKEMLDGEDKLIEGNDTIKENLRVLAESSLTFKEGADTLEKGLGDYVAGVEAVNEGVGQVYDGVEQLEKEAVAGAYQVADGAKELGSSLTSYTDGVASAQSGASTLAANNATLIAGVSSLSSGTTKLQEGGNQILAGMQEMSGTIGATLTPEKQQQLAAAVGGLNALDNSIDTLDAGVNDSQTGLVASMNTLDSYIVAAKGNTDTAKSEIVSAYTTLATLLETDSSLSTQQKQAIQSAMSQLMTTDGSNPTGGAVYHVGYADTVLTNVDNNIKGMVAEDGSVTYLANSVSALNAGADQVLLPSADAITSLENGLLTVKTGLDGTDTSAGLIPGMISVNDGLTALQSGTTTLHSGLTTYTNGVASLNSGLTTLKGYNSDITAGTGKLEAGSSTLAVGLDSGVTKMENGVLTLQSGTKQLVANDATLLSGVSKLSSGASQISDGAYKLADGSDELGNGLTELQDGTLELHDALEDGASEVRDNEATDKNIDMFVAPVRTEETQVTHVENNGHAMAAYMLSVGLWVACLAFCLMYPLTEYKGELKNGFAWWASKAVICYPVALLMAGSSLLILKGTLGFTPESMGRTFLVAAVAAIAFMSIQYFFDVLLGKVGSFIMLIFMVLQLAGSAGTYPIEISGKLAGAIHKFVPFTYSVDAFRSAIAGGQSITVELTVLLVLALFFSVMTIIVFEIRGKRIEESKPIMLDWIEEHGLA